MPMSTPPFAQIVAKAPDMLLLVAADGRIVFANESVREGFGYSPEELVGHMIEELIPARFRRNHQRFRDAYTHAPIAREMGARVVALSAVRRNGSEFPAEIRLAPIEEGGATLVVAAIRDVTERRRVTEALREARAEADAASEAKSRFLAAASHDLRQPLQTLQLLCAALGRKVGDPEALALVRRQRAALDGMGDLLNALLDITRLESGTVVPTFEAVDVGALLDELQRQFEELARARGLGLEFAATDCHLRTDRVLFRQVLQNLLSNALEYTRTGAIVVRVGRQPDGVEFSVQDSGVGIDAAQLERIFDPYVRGRHDGRQGRGFGLGLAIVRQICRLLGYHLHVDSVLGEGSTFRVRVPADCALSAADVPVLASLPAATTGSDLRPSVLVVEDDEDVRSAIELLLRVEGYPTRVAADAEAAERIFDTDAQNIDLIVTDFHLGEGPDGLDALRRMRAIAGRELPAVILSGDTSPALAALRGEPNVLLLRKPVDAGELVTALEQLFGAAT